MLPSTLSLIFIGTLIDLALNAKLKVVEGDKNARHKPESRNR